MKMSNAVGVLFVDSKRMRSVLHDSVLATLDNLKQVGWFGWGGWVGCSIWGCLWLAAVCLLLSGCPFGVPGDGWLVAIGRMRVFVNSKRMRSVLHDSVLATLDNLKQVGWGGWGGWSLEVGCCWWQAAARHAGKPEAGTLARSRRLEGGQTVAGRLGAFSWPKLLSVGRSAGWLRGGRCRGPGMGPAAHWSAP
jgi:hypothetical protein